MNSNSALIKDIANGQSKRTRQQKYSGLSKNMEANRHENSHGIFKGPTAKVPGTETFDVCLNAQNALYQCNHGYCSGKNKF